MGMRPGDRLDASTLSGGKTHNRVAIRTFEWGDPNGRVEPPSGETPVAELGSRLLLRGSFAPISGTVNSVWT